MKTFTHTIANPNGLHGRPAMELIEAVRELDSAVTVCKGDKCAGADRLMALMTLGAAQGDTVTVTVEGGDEARSFEVLKQYFEQHL